MPNPFPPLHSERSKTLESTPRLPKSTFESPSYGQNKFSLQNHRISDCQYSFCLLFLHLILLSIEFAVSRTEIPWLVPFLPQPTCTRLGLHLRPNSVVVLLLQWASQCFMTPLTVTSQRLLLQLPRLWVWQRNWDFCSTAAHDSDSDSDFDSDFESSLLPSEHYIFCTLILWSQSLGCR